MRYLEIWDHRKLILLTKYYIKRRLNIFVLHAPATSATADLVFQNASRSYEYNIYSECSISLCGSLYMIIFILTQKLDTLQLRGLLWPLVWQRAYSVELHREDIWQPQYTLMQAKSDHIDGEVMALMLSICTMCTDLV